MTSISSTTRATTARAGAPPDPPASKPKPAPAPAKKPTTATAAAEPRKTSAPPKAGTTARPQVLDKDTIPVAARNAPEPEPVPPAPPPGPPAKNELYGDKNWPDWQSVKQGSVNSCWFLSAAIQVARDDPKRIQDMIKDNKNGSYTVQFPNVDRGITVTPPGANEGFSTSNGVWMPVLEKAYGTYLADRGPKVEVSDPNANAKAVIMPKPKLGDRRPAQHLGPEPPKYYQNELTPAQAMDGPKNFSYDVGTPWGGLSPFYSISERKEALFIPPGAPGRALAPIVRKNVGEYMEWGVANNSPVTAGTFIDKAGGVSNPNLHAGHIYSLLDFKKNAGDYGASQVELRDPYGKNVNLTLDDFIKNFGAVGASKVPGIPTARKDAVAGYYRDMFGRAGDLSEITWHARSDLSLPQLRRNFATSDEGQRVIWAAYNDILGRKPDAKGLKTWTEFLAAGGDLRGLHAGFRAGKEFKDKNP